MRKSYLWEEVGCSWTLAGAALAVRREVWIPPVATQLLRPLQLQAPRPSNYCCHSLLLPRLWGGKMAVTALLNTRTHSQVKPSCSPELLLTQQSRVTLCPCSPSGPHLITHQAAVASAGGSRSAAITLSVSFCSYVLAPLPASPAVFLSQCNHTSQVHVICSRGEVTTKLRVSTIKAQQQSSQ